MNHSQEQTAIINNYEPLLITGVFLLDYLMLTFFVLSSFWIVKLALRPTKELVIKTTKMSLFIFSILICVYYPVYLIMIISIYLFTKLYYHKRFNFDYPHFRGE